MLLCACGSNGKGSGQPTGEVAAARWSETTARQLHEAIAARAAHGLDRLRFEDIAPGAPLDDAALTRAALAYAAALARGASDPTKLYRVYTLPRPTPDLSRGLAAALADGKVGEWLASLAPQDDGYRALSRAYLALRGHGDAPPAIPQTAAALKPGATDPRIPAIARQLAAFDYLDASAAQGERYTPAMVAAVRRMQADYGITPDGAIGDKTIATLNLSDADRARAIAVDMERLRWLERTPPATRIDVNIAAARLTYWRDGKIADTRKVIVGKPDTATPQIGSPIFSLVANPTWTVPRSIERKEIAGKGAAYLRRNDMMWKDGRVVQRSGPRNALGLVKFDMRNPYAIYLHDTPAKQLFTAVQRERSHGCVRVEDALGFAGMLARDEGVLDRWNAARAHGKEAFVGLPREIPVRLLYQTVLLDKDGDPIVRGDPYGWNDRIATALGFGVAGAAHLRAGSGDLGP
ncbi:L,D-transpeptidase family protein [Sphingomonas sp. CL5.1]|nr:L,D-transpeptidase family protein [Sphingomonas sp. CL5.1]